MPIPPLSLLRHRTPSSLHLLFRHTTTPTPTPTRHLSLSPLGASKPQQQKPRHPNNNKFSKNSFKSIKKKQQQPIKHFSSISLLNFPPPPPPDSLSPSQAIGTVAASHANFMRVIVQNHHHDNKDDENEKKNARYGMELLCVVRALLKKIKRRVLVGDKVVVGSIDWVDRRGMIENVLERKSDIVDPPVANVDHLLVLFSLDQPKLEPFTLTRFLVEAESTGIPLTLALNKVELVDDETLASWKHRLRGWGYEPLFCSAESNVGLDTLAFVLRDQTTVIVGPSGVGKSSLINTLRNNPPCASIATEVDNWFDPILGSKWFQDQKVGEVSTRSGRGKHTTRNVALLPLVGGGYLADTPGFNQPSLLKVTKQSLAQAFPEIQKMLSANESTKCAFKDCLHLGEPGCIVKADWERYPFYFQLLDEIRVREEFQLRTYGTKREGDVRHKVGDMGVQQAEPRLEPKKHRRKSRKRINQSLLDELDELDDDDENKIDEENDPILRAYRNEYQ